MIYFIIKSIYSLGPLIKRVNTTEPNVETGDKSCLSSLPLIFLNCVGVEFSISKYIRLVASYITLPSTKLLSAGTTPKKLRLCLLSPSNDERLILNNSTTIESLTFLKIN